MPGTGTHSVSPGLCASSRPPSTLNHKRVRHHAQGKDVRLALGSSEAQALEGGLEDFQKAGSAYRAFEFAPCAGHQWLLELPLYHYTAQPRSSMFITHTMNVC
jgi:hypothetical protein